MREPLLIPCKQMNEALKKFNERVKCRKLSRRSSRYKLEFIIQEHISCAEHNEMKDFCFNLIAINLYLAILIKEVTEMIIKNEIIISVTILLINKRKLSKPNTH